MERISDDSEHVYDLIGDTLDFAQSVTEHIPFLSELTMGDDILGLRQRIDTLVGEVISNFVSGVSKKLPVWLGAMASAIPSFILFVIVTLISGFYFCVDLGGIHSGIKSLLPTGASEKLAHIKRRVLGTALRYLRAYILLLLMTFGELFIGFSILKIDYALLLAAVIALIDILPVLGVGSVLIPWAAVVLISGNYYLGVGLFILYGCVALVRQISEPKIVGGSLGIHPLLTLISMYAGFKLFGLFGMIIGPAVALVVKSIITTGSLLGEERSR
jgi:sporulation integral membrane protein YtvI